MENCALKLSKYLQTLLNDRWLLSGAITRKPNRVSDFANRFACPSRLVSLEQMRDEAIAESASAPEIATICTELFVVHQSMIAGAVEAAEAGRSNIVSDAYNRHRQLFKRLKISVANSGTTLKLLDKTIE